MRDKIVVSSYYITLNSNLSVYKPENEARIKSFVAGIKRIFLSKNVLNFIKILDEDDKQTYDVRDLLNEINSEITFEVGPSNGYLHVHGIIPNNSSGLKTYSYKDLASVPRLSILSRVVPINAGCFGTLVLFGFVTASSARLSLGAFASLFSSRNLFLKAATMTGRRKDPSWSGLSETLLSSARTSLVASARAACRIQ